MRRAKSLLQSSTTVTATAVMARASISLRRVAGHASRSSIEYSGDDNLIRRIQTQRRAWSGQRSDGRTTNAVRENLDGACCCCGDGRHSSCSLCGSAPDSRSHDTTGIRVIARQGAAGTAAGSHAGNDGPLDADNAGVDDQRPACRG